MTLTLGANVDRAAQPEPAMLTENVDAPCAWRREDLDSASLRIPLDDAVIAELDALAGRLADYDGPIEDLTPTSFDLPATGKLLAQVRDRIDNGIGFAILDRLPIERWDERAAKAVAWLVVAHLGAIVTQKFNGTRLYEVRDKGLSMQHGVRRSITNLDQEFHTDGGWLSLAPETVALACLRQAKVGGLSRVVSLVTVHNDMRKRHGDLLGHLYRPFWWDRQAEHPEGETLCSPQPVYAWDGRRLSARYYDDYVRQGHRMMAQPLDDRAVAALDAMRAIVMAPENWIELRLEPGQIEVVNNHLLAHARTGFQEVETGAERLLLRLWARRTGGIELEPTVSAGP